MHILSFFKSYENKVKLIKGFGIKQVIRITSEEKERAVKTKFIEREERKKKIYLYIM